MYDLGEDHIAPTHNILVMNGLISAFCLGRQSALDLNRGQTTIYVASKDGKVYYQDFTYHLGPRVKKDTLDVEMAQNDNYDMMLTSTVSFNPVLGVKDNDACFALGYSELADLIFMSFQGGLTVAG